MSPTAPGVPRPALRSGRVPSVPGGPPRPGPPPGPARELRTDTIPPSEPGPDESRFPPEPVDAPAEQQPAPAGPTGAICRALGTGGAVGVGAPEGGDYGTATLLWRR